jgi:hypothetical protein
MSVENGKWAVGVRRRCERMGLRRLKESKVISSEALIWMVEYPEDSFSLLFCSFRRILNLHFSCNISIIEGHLECVSFTLCFHGYVRKVIFLNDL